MLPTTGVVVGEKTQSGAGIVVFKVVSKKLTA